MDLVENYFKLREEVFESFGYQENWRAFPMEDRRMFLWYLDESGTEVSYAAKKEDFNERVGNYYSDEVYKYRHLKERVYRNEKYTMILVDTHMDGNILLHIFDNEKEQKESPFVDFL